MSSLAPQSASFSHSSATPSEMGASSVPIISRIGKALVLKKTRCSFHAVNPVSEKEEQCRVRLKEIDRLMQCKCKQIFCNAHRHNHGCSFDHLKAHQEKLKQQFKGQGSYRFTFDQIGHVSEY